MNHLDRLEAQSVYIFREAFHAKYGTSQAVSDLMASAYISVKLWAKAATAAGSVDPTAVLAAIGGMSFDGPGATVTIDPDNHHTWRPVRIGRIQTDGQVALLPGSDAAIRPESYPDTRTPTEWHRFLADLYRGWGYRWEAPPKR